MLVGIITLKWRCIKKIVIYSTYLATCRQLDDPRYLTLYYQQVSAACLMIIVRNHSETSQPSSVSEALAITFCLISTVYKKFSNFPRSQLTQTSAINLLLLTEYSHQELVQVSSDLLSTHHYCTDCVIDNQCTFQWL